MTASKYDQNVEDHFVLNFVKVDYETHTLRIVNPKNGEVTSEIPLIGKLRRVDSALKSELKKGYLENFSQEIVGSDFSLELPSGEHEHPLALIFSDGKTLLLWLESKEARDQWKEELDCVAYGSAADAGYLIYSSNNFFTQMVYKSLVIDES